jgi:uncharacterized protein
MQILKQSLILLLFSAVVGQLAVSQSGQDEQAPSNDLSVEQRARNGDPEAQDEMGLAAEERRQYAEALKWFQLAAQQGLSKSQVKVGYFYDEGLGVLRDHVQAVHWYTLAAVQGDPQAEFDLGMCYHKGEGVQSNDATQNRADAIKWFSSALSHGYANAANGLGLVYEFGSASDYKEALRWYKKGAELEDEEAQYNTCRLMVQGLGGPRDYSEAFHWCSESADGSTSFSSWGQYGLGRLYEDGSGIQPDYAEAAGWYRKSAEQGNPAAQLRLAELYSKGKGVTRDFIEAYMWVAVAGSLGDPDALEELQSLSAKMKKADLLTAQARARGWIEQHPPDPEDNPAESILYHHN